MWGLPLMAAVRPQSATERIVNEMTNDPQKTPIYPDKAADFRLAEYIAVRSEITERLTELWKLEKFALGGAAAIAAWLLTHKTEFPKGDVAW